MQFREKYKLERRYTPAPSLSPLYIILELKNFRDKFAFRIEIQLYIYIYRNTIWLYKLYFHISVLLKYRYNYICNNFLNISLERATFMRIN